MRTLKEKGPEALDDELLRKLQAHGINVSFDSESFDSDPLQSLKANGYIINEAAPLEYPSTAVHIRTGKRIKGFLRRLFSKTGGVRQKPGSISPMDITKLAGGALSPEERRQCPNPKCQAVIPKDAKKCTWFGELL